MELLHNSIYITKILATAFTRILKFISTIKKKKKEKESYKTVNNVLTASDHINISLLKEKLTDDGFSEMHNSLVAP